MKFKFTKEKINEIEQVLNIKFAQRDNQYRAILENKEQNRKLTLEIFTDIPIGVNHGNLINVFTLHGHAQLHLCTGFVASDTLGEVTFIGEHAGRLSGIIVEQGAAFSIYSNVDATILSTDFTKLGPEVMLSGVALSLAEHLLESRSTSEDE
jgi:hypothetical protein